MIPPRPGPTYPSRTVAERLHHELIDIWAAYSSPLTYAAVILISVYFIFGTLVPAPVSRAIWRLLVFLAPSRIVFALDRRRSGHQDPLIIGRDSKAKSEAMQRIFGLDGTSIFSGARSNGPSSLTNALSRTRDILPAGLGNWDNSCYQNSIIQGLASLRSVDAFLESNTRILTFPSTASTHLALKETINQLNDPSHASRRIWLPPELKSMCSWQQQDAQEYFSKIVEQLDKEIRRGTRGVTTDVGFKLAGPPTNQKNDGDKEKVQEIEIPRRLGAVDHTGPFQNPLEGMLAQRVGCMRCGWVEGLSLTPFNCLTVSLGKNHIYDVRDCLDEYTTLEPIEGVECSRCTLLRNESQLQQLIKQADENVVQNGNDPKLREAFKENATSRLKAVQAALEEEDFSEKTLSEKCHIAPKNRVTATKSRQAVIGRAPQSLVVHINRSLFDEVTGMLMKNYAAVNFPAILDLDEWCLGTKPVGTEGDTTEHWGINPSESMLADPESNIQTLDRKYELRAVITHYGRHENGHYICYRKYPAESFPARIPDEVLDDELRKEKAEHWFRLSDDDVGLVSESHVMAQGGVFMLFYERMEPASNTHDQAGVSVAETADHNINGPNVTVGPGENDKEPSCQRCHADDGSVPSLASDSSDSSSSRSSSEDHSTTAESNRVAPAIRASSSATASEIGEGDEHSKVPLHPVGPPTIAAE